MTKKEGKRRKTGEFSKHIHPPISSLFIPTSIFQDRSLSVLEALAEYLKEEACLRFSEIGVLLNRDQRTVWTAYARAKKKRKKKPVKENE